MIKSLLSLLQSEHNEYLGEGMIIPSPNSLKVTLDLHSVEVNFQIKKIPSPWGRTWDYDINIPLEKCIVKRAFYHILQTKINIQSQKQYSSVYAVNFSINSKFYSHSPI